MAENADAEKSDAEKPAPKPKMSRLKLWTIRLLIVGVVMLLLGGCFVGVAEHHTSQAQFCGSCHIMEPYYDTWSADVHGTKLDVACVECHYAPGERTTIKAKFRGLSQVTSYFSGRYGATRPRAFVSNLSCLTAKCHGDLTFMDKPILLGTVKFTHANHLQRDGEKEKTSEQRLADLEKTLKTLVGDEHFSELESAATQAGPADERYDKLVVLAQQWNVNAERDTLVEFSQLHHRKVRVAQLSDLQCTNCHAYHATNQESASGHARGHFQVSTTTCYTCHFNNEGFNTGTNKCLMCHTPPQQEIIVHSELAGGAGEKLQGSELGTKLVKMNHTDILARKVDCLACHADAARSDSTVTRRDCERCHDQERFFADWKEPFTLSLVTRYHQVHVEQQRAKCLDCHSEIKHKLVPDGDGDPNKGFLRSVLTDCTRCHPKHHEAQVDLLLGRGGIGVPKSAPNLMFGARTNCTGCHIELSSDAHGSSVIKATASACVACHGDRHKDTFEKWKLGLELVMGDADQAYQNATQLLQEQSDAPADKRQQATDLIKAAEADLQLVKRGNGLHNINYSIELLDSVTSRCQQAIELLSGG